VDLLVLRFAVVIKLFQPEPLEIDLPTAPSETEPLLSPAEGTNASSASAGRTVTRKVVHSPTFELVVVRVSIAIEILAYGLMGTAATGAAYVSAGVLAALGAGFSPALQTVALAMYARKGGNETGRLFGALSVVHSLS
jgi:hypothetical protein